MSVRDLCHYFDVSRAAYYRWLSEHERRREYRSSHESLVLKGIRSLLAVHPHMGTRKMQVKLREQSLVCGRDHLAEIRRRHGLAQARKHRRIPRTTNSNHSWRTFPDVYNGCTFTRIFEAYVCDITYIPIGKQSFAYLSLAMDVATRYIVGYGVHETLSHHGAAETVRMALAIRNKYLPYLDYPLIHHSDRGTQYCCYEYQKILRKHGVIVSMTQSGDPRDNGKAERLNGILKLEYLDMVFDDYGHAKLAVRQAVTLYNNVRPHQALMYQTPKKVFHSLLNTLVTSE